MKSIINALKKEGKPLPVCVFKLFKAGGVGRSGRVIRLLQVDETKKSSCVQSADVAVGSGRMWRSACI